MPIPPFILAIREKIGHDELWLPGTTAVITRGSGPGLEVLLVRRADTGAWAPVTGVVDPGEDPAVAAAREAMEEACVEVTVERLASVSVIRDVVYANGDRAAYLDTTFACRWVSGEAAVGDDESTDVRWWPADALPEMPAGLRARIDAALSDETAARFVGPGSVA